MNSPLAFSVILPEFSTKWFVYLDVHFGALRLGGTGSASVRERLAGPGEALEQARPHWQSQWHPTAL